MQEIEGMSLQDAIQFVVHQRDRALAHGFGDVAAFWSDELVTLRSQVPARPAQPVQFALCEGASQNDRD